MNSKKNDNIQRLIIPKGSISPNEVVVIKIPKRHKRTPVVVARRNRADHITQSQIDNNFISAPKDSVHAVRLNLKKYIYFIS